ncbi:MAG: hypothetical protein WBN55_14465, partial [Eudoraea sp.]|uniref:alpha/beta hydrolase n=1 Tax=Eudoraea sp. TaxID=1979955 RepID=UPI003C7103D7
ILFIFEPAGRGRLGVETFIEASETYGHILVCSNNSRNGPYDRNFNIAANLFDHVFSRYKIDENQMVLAGFSGGSRLAWSIALAGGNIAGVLACGAGISEIQQPILQRQEFSYVGICGNRDMNYREMQDLNTYMSKVTYDHTLFTFDGGHIWPPPEEITKAFDWLALQLHKKGNASMTDDELYKSYKHNYKNAQKSEADGHILNAVENYERVLSTYDSIFTLDTVSVHLNRLKKENSYKKAFKDRTLAFEKEKQWANTFYERFSADYNQPEKADLDWWEKKIRQLNDKYANTNTEFQHMLERIQFNLYAMAFSRNNPNLYQSTEAQRNFCSALGKLVYSD